VEGLLMTQSGHARFVATACYAVSLHDYNWLVVNKTNLRNIACQEVVYPGM
jgi:hypothetical protein